MITTKIIFMAAKKDLSQRAPVYIRIIKSRKPIYINTGVRLLEGEWDDRERKVKNSATNATRINTLLTSKIAAINKAALNFEEKGNRIHPK